MRVCMRACVSVCVCACACVRGRVSVCVCVCCEVEGGGQYLDGIYKRRLSITITLNVHLLPAD